MFSGIVTSIRRPGDAMVWVLVRPRLNLLYQMKAVAFDGADSFSCIFFKENEFFPD